MTSIVERLRLLVPSDSSGAAFDAVNEITRLTAEVEDLSSRLHHVHRLWANNEHARARDPRLHHTAHEGRGVMDCLCIKCSDKRFAAPPWNGVISIGDPAPPFRYACEICGNKRCPHHTDHNLTCTGSNEPGQKGSIYE